jgi:STE24 endopeptidase
MTGFDPAVATAAYLAQMSPGAQARAIAYTHGKEWLLLGEWVVNIVVAWLIVRSSVLTSLRDMWQRRQRRPLLASFVVAIGYFVLNFILTLPWEIWSQWWFEKDFGMTSQPLEGWLMDGLIKTAFSVPNTAKIIELLY